MASTRPPHPPAPRGRAEPWWARSLRRGFLVVLLAFLGGSSLLLWAWLAQGVDTAGRVAFDRALQVPPLATAETDPQGRRVFQLTAAEGETDLGGASPTRTRGFQGAHLGPTLRAQRGEEVVVHVRNGLDEATTVHWHGMELPASMDGGPHRPVAPGGLWSPSWTVDQPAATLWYHPHPHGETAEQVAQGMVGMFIVDDPVEQALDLPGDYGVDDLPVIVQDVTLEQDGRLRTGADLGDTVLVNGTPGPYAVVSTERVRLRLLNASVQRTYDFGLDDGSVLTQVAGDGGLLPAPHRTSRVQLSPGERAEVVITMTPGETRVLRSHPPDLGVSAMSARFSGGGDTLDVLQLRARPTLEPSPEVPDTLASDAPDLAEAEAEAVRTRTFRLQGRTINGAVMDMDRVDEVVTAGETEVWEVLNSDGEPHNFHVHGVQMRVLTVGGRPAGPELAGLKDTVLLPAGQPVRMLVTLPEHVDPEVPYMYHCHLLRHEDQGMMGQFVVLPPGGAGAGQVAPPAGHTDH
jgi:FtsP/CotA-like multicopper oxidase with cupredoxin domain